MLKSSGGKNSFHHSWHISLAQQCSLSLSQFLFCILNILNMNRKWLLNYEVHLLLKITDLRIDASICFKLLNSVFLGIMYASSFRVGGMDVTQRSMC
jgi:hypothetical protein